MFIIDRAEVAGDVPAPAPNPIDPAWAHRVHDLVGLRGVMPDSSRAIVGKVRDHLNQHLRGFLDHLPFYLVATSSAAGTCDVSPKG